MQTELIRHMLVRVILLWTALAVIFLKRIEVGETTRGSLGLAVLVTLFFEITFYALHREKVILFQRFKEVSLQEEQFRGLIDVVPDKVLIMSKTGDEKAHRGLYSNQVMNSFFGCSLVEQSHSKKEKKRERNSEDKE